MLILNKRVDDEMTRDVYEYFKDHPDKAELMIYGIGGNVIDAFAIADMILAHSNVVGIATSQVNSSHMDIFMACQHRYFMPNTVLGYHHISHHIDGYASPQELSNTLREHNSYALRYARLYSNASNLSSEEWLDMLDAVGSDGTGVIDAYGIERYGIASPITEYRFAF